MLRCLKHITDPRHAAVELHDFVIIVLTFVLCRAAWLKGDALDLFGFATAGLILAGALAGAGLIKGQQRKIDPACTPPEGGN